MVPVAVTVGRPEWRLATFNIQYAAANRWLRKRERLAAVLRGLKADVLGLQEVSAEGLEWIREALGHPLCVAAGREDGARAGEHVPILVLNPAWSEVANGTFWFSQTPTQPSVAWGAAHPRICTWVRLARPDAPDLTVFNVHLDHRSSRAREESGRLLKRYVETKAANGLAVVCGDFNERRAERVRASFEKGEPALVDAAAKAGVLTPTWRGISRLGAWRARLDYALIDARLSLRHYALTDNVAAGRTLSDHRPVVVDLAG